MKDYIDIVNESDLVIGRKPKDLVHKEGDWHRVAHVWILNSKGEMLIHKRAASKKIFPGLWDTIIGGHLKGGESYNEAAKRELREELGVKNFDTLTELGKWKNIPNILLEPKNKEFVKIFALKYDGEIKDFRPQKSEISELKFIKPSKLKVISKDKKQRSKFISFGYFDKILPKIKAFFIEKTKRYN